MGWRNISIALIKMAGSALESACWREYHDYAIETRFRTAMDHSARLVLELPQASHALQSIISLGTGLSWPLSLVYASVVYLLVGQMAKNPHFTKNEPLRIADETRSEEKEATSLRRIGIGSHVPPPERTTEHRPDD